MNVIFETRLRRAAMAILAVSVALTPLAAAAQAPAARPSGQQQPRLAPGLAAYTESGVIGRPSLASADKGRDALASLVASFGETLSALE